MSYLHDHIDVRFDVSPDLDPELILLSAHRVLSEVGFVPTMGLASFFSHHVERQLSDSDRHAFSYYNRQEWQKYHDEVASEKARLNPGGHPATPPLPPDEEVSDELLSEVDRLKSLPLPRLPHWIFGMKNAVSRSPLPLKLLPERFFVKLCLEYTLDLREFGMDPYDRSLPALQNWSLERPYTVPTESVEPETAGQLWLRTDVPFSIPACGFTRYLQLAMQETAIRLHRELSSRETVGVKWDIGYDPRYPESTWKAVPVFRFGSAGNEFMWDYVPKHFPDWLPLIEPHEDAQLEADVTEYERWLKATYCR